MQQLARAALDGGRRRLLCSSAAGTSGGERVCLPLLRLPTILFPTQSLSLQLVEHVEQQQPATVLPKHLADLVWLEHGGKMAALGPCGHVGVELTILYDQVLESEHPTPPGVAHAVGGARIRLLRSRTIDAIGTRMATLEPLTDDTMSVARVERLLDEADRARTLMALGAQRGAFELEFEEADDEGGPPVCDARAHPLWGAQWTPPAEAEALSLWLAARLPLTTRLRMHVLQCTCPLKRMRDAVDAMRLLLDPGTRRFEHRFRLFVHTPSSDGCNTLGGPRAAPRYIVGDAAPRYAWGDESSFPHG